MKEGWKEEMKEGMKEWGKEGREEGREEERKEGRNQSINKQLSKLINRFVQEKLIKSGKKINQRLKLNYNTCTPHFTFLLAHCCSEPCVPKGCFSVQSRRLLKTIMHESLNHFWPTNCSLGWFIWLIGATVKRDLIRYNCIWSFQRWQKARKRKECFDPRSSCFFFSPSTAIDIVLIISSKLHTCTCKLGKFLRLNTIHVSFELFN